VHLVDRLDAEIAIVSACGTWEPITGMSRW
jgi:hypothetical protein